MFFLAHLPARFFLALVRDLEVKKTVLAANSRILNLILAMKGRISKDKCSSNKMPGESSLSNVFLPSLAFDVDPRFKKLNCSVHQSISRPVIRDVSTYLRSRPPTVRLRKNTSTKDTCASSEGPTLNFEQILYFFPVSTFPLIFTGLLRAVSKRD